MTSHTYISDLPGRIGDQVSVRGWVATIRSSGKIAFLVLRDGTGYLQCVASKSDVDGEIWEAFRHATQESSVTISGSVRADTRSPGGVELSVSGFAAARALIR